MNASKSSNNADSRTTNARISVAEDNDIWLTTKELEMKERGEEEKIIKKMAKEWCELYKKKNEARQSRVERGKEPMGGKDSSKWLRNMLDWRQQISEDSEWRMAHYIPCGCSTNNMCVLGTENVAAIAVILKQISGTPSP